MARATRTVPVSGHHEITCATCQDLHHRFSKLIRSRLSLPEGYSQDRNPSESGPAISPAISLLILGPPDDIGGPWNARAINIRDTRA